MKFKKRKKFKVAEGDTISRLAVLQILKDAKDLTAGIGDQFAEGAIIAVTSMVAELPAVQADAGTGGKE